MTPTNAVESRINPLAAGQPTSETALMDSSTATPLAALNDPSLLKTDALINGEWVQGGSRFDVLDPATGHKLADVANLGPADAEKAIAAANAARSCNATLQRLSTRKGPLPSCARG